MSDLSNQILKLSRILAASKKHGMPYAVWDRDVTATQEAATALEAQAKELAALRGELTDTQQALTSVNSDWNKAIARAETAERVVIAAWNAFGGPQIATMKEAEELALIGEGDLDEQIKTQVEQLAAAERERDEARAALKPFTAYTVVGVSEGGDSEYRIHVQCSVEKQPQFRHFDAARAITGED